VAIAPWQCWPTLLKRRRSEILAVEEHQVERDKDQPAAGQGDRGFDGVEQNTRNQRRELKAAAERRGWSVAGVYEDEGISGARGRDGRPGLDAVLKAITRREFDMVAAWSVDRLGRSLTDFLGVLGELHANDVALYLHQQGLDTTTPSGRAMFQMMGVFAEFEGAMIRERVMAGLARAREEGTKLGRRPIEEADARKAAAIRASLAKRIGVRRIARDLGVGVGTIIRIRDAGALRPSKPEGR